jgi:putative heme-binding domain-containing protein
MKRIALTFGAAAALLACVAKQPENQPKTAPERAIFDGQTLAGWDGDPRYWSVENGCIVGRSTAANPLRETTYLVWRGGQVADFELRCEFKITGGNSGVQFRSRDLGHWKVAGYQADMEDGPSWTGCLYEQEGRGVVATRGQQLVLDQAHGESNSFGDAAELLTHVRVHDWNEYVIRAVGDAIELSINGTRMTQVVDHDAQRRRHDGILALQLHQGAPMQVEYRNMRLLDLGSSAVGAPAGAAAAALAHPKHVPSPGQPPQWIWTSDKSADGERAAFARRFDLPSGVTHATLRGACDNRMRLFVNGELAADTNDWNEPVEVDVGKFVHAGDNEIAIAAHNDSGPAALWVELVVEAGNKRVLRLLSDASWSATRLASDGALEAWAPKQFDAKHASPPHVLGSFGCAPWGSLGAVIDVAKGAPKVEDELALDGSKLEVPDGFRAELLYSVPKSTQGSWVSMAEDPRGRLYVSDQYGGLYRVTPPPIDGPASATIVEPVDVDIGESQGMCWAFDSLYVTVNAGGDKHHSGLYRVRDTNGDDQLDLVTCLREFDGEGEHGPHAVVLGPDDHLWIVAGNFTHLPEPIDNYHRPKNWAEDELLPHLPDANGHDPHIMAPGGWVCRTDQDGKSWELWCAGMRNAYDIAFDENGELFTFDSDMEWDIGAPWYRPTRILHLVSGADFGWRNGSGKWPAYWPDTLPSVVDIGPGSPTGIAFGKQAKFPNKWRDSLFVLDWAYGTIFAVHLNSRDGATFEPFIKGKPFPVTDIVIARDDAMYITTGGRRTQSGLYRVAWTRDLEPADRLARDRDATRARSAATAAPARDPTQDKWRGAPVNKLMAAIGSSNALEVLGARVEFEKRDFGEWRGALESEQDPARVVQLVLAALHSAPAEQRELILAKLEALPVEHFSVYPRIDIYRLYQLALLRLAPLDDATLARFRARLEPQFPSRFERVNYVLAELLAYLEVPSTIGKCLDLIAKATTQEEKLQYVYCLRAMKGGWTIEQRQRFFEFLETDAKTFTGGASLKGFVSNMRDEAIATLSDEEKLALGDMVVPSKPAASSGTAVVASFIRAWNAEELAPKLRGPLHDRSFEHGQAAFAKASCAQCHRIAGEGGATGPDLTGAGSRFSRADLLDAILEPSKAISDQFQDTEVRTKDGDLYVGRIERDDANGIALRRLPPSEDVIELDRAEIESRRLHPLSRMPSGLLDVLSEDEILDLFAYVLSGGDAHNASFTQ